MNRVLDIDLDFFLADCCPLADVGQRPILQGHEPWQESRVIDFLENNCGLSTAKPIKARLFETHDKALSYWQELMRAGKLTAPFQVVHIDAHSDLGIGYPGPGFVLNTVLSMKPDIRCDIHRYYDMKQLDEANYLLFALGFRYISRLDNIRNPMSRRDMPPEILVNGAEGKEYLQLQSFASRFFETENGKEPLVEYNQYEDYRDYRADGAFDYGSLAISPRYAPKEADSLISVIGRYLDFE